MADLTRQLEKLRAAEGDFTAQLEADLAFHERMCELSGNATLLYTWHTVSGLARAAITAAGPETALHNMAYDRHRPIVDLIEAGDVAGGATFLDGHMSDAAERVIARMTQSAADRLTRPPARAPCPRPLPERPAPTRNSRVTNNNDTPEEVGVGAHFSGD